MGSFNLKECVAKLVYGSSEGTLEGDWNDKSVDQKNTTFKKCEQFELTQENNEKIFLATGEYDIVVRKEFGDQEDSYKILLQNKLDKTKESLCAAIQEGDVYIYGVTFDDKEEVGLFLDELLVLSKKEESSVSVESKEISSVVEKLCDNDKSYVLLAYRYFYEKYGKKNVDVDSLKKFFPEFGDQDMNYICSKLDETFEYQEYQALHDGESYFVANTTAQDFAVNVAADMLKQCDYEFLFNDWKADFFDKKENRAGVVKMVVDQQKTATKE